MVPVSPVHMDADADADGNAGSAGTSMGAAEGLQTAWTSFDFWRDRVANVILSSYEAQQII